MINMKDLIKKQGDMIRKESGMNIKEELLNERSYFQKWQNHLHNLEKLYLSVHQAKKAIPHKKKELMKIEKLYKELHKLVDIIVGSAVDM